MRAFFVCVCCVVLCSVSGCDECVFFVRRIIRDAHSRVSALAAAAAGAVNGRKQAHLIG